MMNGSHAGVDARILGLHVLEDQGQGVLIFAEKHLEALLGIEFLAISLPLEDWLLSSWQNLSTQGPKRIPVLYKSLKIVRKYSFEYYYNNLPTVVAIASQLASPNLFVALHEYVPLSVFCTSAITSS